MLLTKQVKIKWNSKHKNKYEELGYIYTKMGDEFLVDIKHLAKNSHHKVLYKCDRCGKTNEIKFQSYNKKNNKNKIDLCFNCSRVETGKIIKIKNLENEENTLQGWFKNNNIDIFEHWDFENNVISPKDITYGNSDTKVWFKCSNTEYHGSYQMRPNSFIRGQRCPYCGHNQNVHPKDSLGQYIVDNYGEDFLEKVWSEKNEMSPFDVAIGSGVHYWWKCPDGIHDDFKREGKGATRCEFRCECCSRDGKYSMIEEMTYTYLKDLGYDVLREYDCTLKIKNPKTNHLLPYDNEIILKNGKHLIIEVHGGQHYGTSFYRGYFKKSEIEAQKMLRRRQILDRFKRIKCRQSGYEYLEIPYWSFNKEEDYKKLINNKIEELRD